MAGKVDNIDIPTMQPHSRIFEAIAQCESAPYKLIDLRYLLRAEIAEKAAVLAAHADMLASAADIPSDQSIMHHFEAVAKFSRYLHLMTQYLERANMLASQRTTRKSNKGAKR